jgi:hypothetical protein
MPRTSRAEAGPCGSACTAGAIEEVHVGCLLLMQEPSYALNPIAIMPEALAFMFSLNEEMGVRRPARALSIVTIYTILRSLTHLGGETARRSSGPSTYSMDSI